MRPLENADESILVVEGDKSRYTEITALLSSLPYHVVSALSLKHAVSRLEADPSIRAILTNVDIGDRSAVDLIKIARRTPRFQYLPVLVYGSDLSTQDIVSFGKAGAVAVLSHPISLDLLRDRLESAVRNGRRRILVVDDEEVIREVLIETLTLERFSAVGVASAEEAQAMLDQESYHLVISDIMLPARSGLDLLAEIKMKNPDLPVVLITGYSGHYTPDNAIASGADGYFVKPFKNVELIRVVRQVLARAASARHRASAQ